MTIYSVLSGESMESIFKQYGGKNFGEFKSALTDLAVAHLAPITSRMNELLANQDEIDRILAKGTAKCQSIAQPFLKDTMDIMGFWKG